MAYSALTTGEVAVDAPVSNPLMTKVKDNFDYLKALEIRLPRAFVTYTVSGDTITNSFNIASVTRTGTGVYAVVFSAALTSTTYSVVITCSPNGAKTVNGYATSLLTTGFTIGTNSNDDGNSYDPTGFTFVVFKNA